MFLTITHNNFEPIFKFSIFVAVVSPPYAPALSRILIFPHGEGLEEFKYDISTSGGGGLAEILRLGRGLGVFDEILMLGSGGVGKLGVRV